MSHGEMLYLLLVIGSFGLFMAALAYVTNRYVPRERALLARAAPAADARHAAVL